MKSTAITLAACELLLDPIHEQRAVRQIREGVVIGLVMQLLLEAPSLMTACSSRSYWSATLALLASASSSRRSSGPYPRSIPKRFASMIVPIIRLSPGSIATIA